MDILEVSVDHLLKELRDDTRLNSGPMFLVVDIGATNARFGLAPRNSTTVHIRFVKTQVKSIPQLLRAFNTFADQIGPANCKRIASAALNLPGPVQGATGGPIANYEGQTSADKILHLSALPTTICPLHHTAMLNDLEACAYGVVAAHHYQIFGAYFATLWRGTAPQQSSGSGSGSINTLAQGHCVVVAPGTGLGVAVVQYHPFSGKYTVLPLEFGHSSVQSETDKDFQEAYKAELQRGNYAVEYDDICSGRGLERLYRFLVAKRPSTALPTNAKTGNASAKEISDLARARDPTALAAVALYHKFLMRCCSQMAIGFVPHTIVLCGDNTVHNGFFYDIPGTVDNMRRTLLDHSCERMQLMSRPSMLRQSKLGNFNLLGCLYTCEGAARKVSKL